MVRQQVQWMEWVPNPRLGSGGLFANVPLQERPSRVWTLIAPARQDSPPALSIVPRHGDNAFLEDYVHDWNWRSGVFRYYTRVSAQSGWVLLEYDDA